MSKVAIYVDDSGNYSAATALGILCHGVDRDTAADAILDALDVSTYEVEVWLDNPVSAAEYRAAFMQAVGSTFAATANNAAVVGLLTTLTVQMHGILQRLEDYETRETVAALQGKVLRLVDRLKAEMAAKGINNIDDATIIKFLLDHGEPTALELKQLLQGVNHD